MGKEGESKLRDTELLRRDWTVHNHNRVFFCTQLDPKRRPFGKVVQIGKTKASIPFQNAT